jgi:hypothetical protein
MIFLFQSITKEIESHLLSLFWLTFSSFEKMYRAYGYQ